MNPHSAFLWDQINIKLLNQVGTVSHKLNYNYGRQYKAYTTYPKSRASKFVLQERIPDLHLSEYLPPKELEQHCGHVLCVKTC